MLPNSNHITFRARLWLWPGPAAWHFISLPKKLSADLRQTFHGFGRGFGSLRVRATIGSTGWNTSIFPDSKSGSYLLPIKKSVRVAENLRAEKLVRVTLEIRL